jgi:hypothetical protein
MFKVGPVTKYDPKLDSVVTPRLEQTKQDFSASTPAISRQEKDEKYQVLNNI